MRKEEVVADANFWMAKRGIPFSPEVVSGWGNDGPLDEETILMLSHLMTNVGRPVFAFTDAMPQEVSAALFARYSRSPRPLRLVLVREFTEAEGLRFQKQQEQEVVSREKAGKLFERVLVGYGDDSVAQLGGVRVACEMVSQLAVKEIEDGRLAAYLEKSTRYVDFGKKVNGAYLYFRPPEIAATPLRDEYEGLMDEAFDLYRRTAEELRSYYAKMFPKEEGVDEAVYRASIRAKAFDIARVFLPMATLTNVGLAASAQAIESMVNKMRTSPLTEARWLAEEIKTEVDEVIPSLLIKLDQEKYGGKARGFLSSSREKVQEVAEKYLGRLETVEMAVEPVELVWSGRENLDKVVGLILFPEIKRGRLAEVRELVNTMTGSEKKEIVEAAFYGRSDRRHKPGRAFEEAEYTFSIRANVGVWRDLQRHRMLTPYRQVLGVGLGTETPDELTQVELDGKSAAKVYGEHMTKRAELHKRISESISPEAAQYVVGFGHLMDWVMQVNLRELYHMIPLRAGAAGHPAYRKIAREMFYKVLNVDPILAMPMEPLVDFSDERRLERLQQLQKVKEKLSRLGGNDEDTFGEGK